jgi:hypothetical protein
MEIEESAVDFRKMINGDGDAPQQPMVDIVPLFEGCSLFIPNPDKPPPDEEMPVAPASVLQKWMVAHPIRVRETLPIVKDGNTVALFVWWERAAK